MFAQNLSADEVRYKYDHNFPRDVLSVVDFRSTLRGIDQNDIGPLKPSAKFILDQMEWSSNASAQAQYVGTGVTITSQSVSGTLVQEGSFSLKAVTDATANRSFERSFVVNLSAYQKIKLWERSSQAADTFQFYVEDSSGNQSYWDITSNASADTWQQDEIDLTSPDGNNGTAADLSDITAYGYRELTASKTYYFDTLKATVGMTVAVRGTNLGDYYKQVYLGSQPLLVDAQAAPTLVAPGSNPRIDILVAHSSGTVSFITGSEASSPTAPWASVSADVVPIAEVYLKPAMTAVLDYEDKDTDATQGYILADVRPFIKLGATTFLGLTDTPSSYTANQYVKVNSSGSALELGAISQTFLGLTDTPSSYAGQATKLPRVNSGATAIEFVTVDGAGAVAKTGDQTIAGVKTFSSFPVSPSSAPTSDYQTANKKYVDDIVAGIVLPQYTAGDNLIHTNDTVTSAQTTRGAWVKVKEITINEKSGTLRIKFDGCFSGDDGGALRLYRNGLAVGTQRTATPGCPNTYTTYSEDISGWAVGDKIQLYVYNNSGSGTDYIGSRNLRLYSAEFTNDL